MDEILAKLDALINEMDGSSVKVGLRGAAGEMGELLQVLVEGREYLRKARASYRRARVLMRKGYGRLVEPEE